VDLIRGKGPDFLSLVKVKDDKESGMQHDFGVRKKSPTPTSQTLGRNPQLVEKPLARLQMARRIIPSASDDIFEPRDPSPKILKLESAGLARVPIIREQKRAMIRQG
jgi:hypothetical protein